MLVTAATLMLMGAVPCATASQDRPDFSGIWITVSPPEAAGQKLTIRQDALSLTMEHPSEGGVHSFVYKLDGTESRIIITAHGSIDIVAKARWNGRSLIIEERRWTAPGEEPSNVKQVLSLDDRGLLTVEVLSAAAAGKRETSTVVLKRDAIRDGRLPRSAASLWHPRTQR